MVHYDDKLHKEWLDKQWATLNKWYYPKQSTNWYSDKKPKADYVFYDTDKAEKGSKKGSSALSTNTKEVWGILIGVILAVIMWIIWLLFKWWPPYLILKKLLKK